MSIDAALGRLGNKSGVCTSSTRPTNPFEGQLIYETDTNRTLVYDNAAWLVVADNQVLSIDPANSRVGIGTTSPSEALDVRGDISLGVLGSNAGRLLLDNTTDSIQRISVSRGGSTGQLAFHTGADTEAVRITNSGNVGIGDTSPSYTLDVNGDINATGDVRVAGTALGRGVVDYERVTGGTNPRVYTAYVETDLSTITFTASAGRLYKATGIVHVFSAPSLCQAFGIIDLNGSNLTATYQTSEGTSYYSSIVTIGTFTASGSTTVKFQIRPNNSLNVYMGGSEGWLLLIEDIGPS